MMLASYLVCVAFSNAGLGAAAAANFPIMEHYNVPHGIATVIFLPAVMEFNLASNYEKYANIARFLGQNVDGLTVGEAAQMSVKAIKDLIKDVGVPTSITEFGVRQEDIPRLATEAMNVKRHIDGNPRRLITKDMENIYKKTMVGY
jgi:alcohol dehydrogenase class IV